MIQKPPLFVVDRIGVPVIAGLAVGIVFVILFSAMFAATSTNGVDRVSVVTTIPRGSGVESRNFEPEIIKIVIGVNNTVRQVSEDTIPYSITSDAGYRDPTTGKAFNIRKRPEAEGGPSIMDGETFEFEFTEAGEYISPP